MFSWAHKTLSCRLFSKHSKPLLDIDLDPAAYFQSRQAHLSSLKSQSLNPYPHKFSISHTFSQFTQDFSSIATGETLNKSVSIAGRVIAIRDYGKLIFLTLLSEGNNLQVMANVSSYRGNFEEIRKIHRGDILGVTGKPCRTSPKGKEGTLSILPMEIKSLAYCLHMLPGHTGLKDQETRFRQRYLDLIINTETRETFKTRAKIIQFLRNFLRGKEFLEVETPMMTQTPGGAAAKPFETHHLDLDLNLYMRIAPELFLKQLVVGGFEKVFEIGKQFRNESIDSTHNPEFTTCELYWAYADYYDLMQMTEEFLSSLVLEINGSYQVNYAPEGGKPKILDFTPPFRRVSMIEELEKHVAEKFPADLASEQCEEFLKRICDKFGVSVAEPKTVGRMLDKLCGRFVEHECENPTFVMNHPQVMSPLAKFHRSAGPGLGSLSERFELFVNGQEICNAYTELNDPVIQRQLFAEQMKLKKQGDEEAQVLDEEFCKSLEYGLPPTGGWGLGIDRLVMILCNKANIKEVLLFPAMKPIING